MTIDNPLMIDWRRHLTPMWENEDGAGGGENTGGDVGAGADDGGDVGADDNSGDTPDPVLGGGTGKAEDNSEKGDEAAEKSGSDDDGAGDEGDEDNTVPEGDAKYEFALPDGLEVDEVLAETMTPLLKDLKIGKADANKMAEALTSYMQGQADAMVSDYVKQVETWTEAAKSDKELGADWNKTVAVANNALQKFGTPEMTQALAETGMSNHPEMIRFMLRVAKATGNDTLDRGKDVDTSELPTEKAWYGNTTPDKKAG